MNVAVTFNLKTASHSQSPPAPSNPLIENPARRNGSSRRFADTFAEWDDPETVHAVTAALEEEGNTVTELEAREDFARELSRLRPDIVFNIAEGIGARSREAQVPAICEMHGIPHTGSDAVTLGICLDKAHTKEILSHHRIPTARFMLAYDAGEITALPFAYPVFLKPVHEGSSKGIFSTSICNTLADVRRETERIVASYSQPALIEEYLPGREFTVAILGNGNAARALPIVEYNFASLPADFPPIDSFEAKWIYDRPDTPLDALRCPATIPHDLRDAIESMCLRAYHVFRINDWARIDVRLDASGAPHIIEINPLPGILPNPADNSCFPAAARAAGYSYNSLIQIVLHLAAERHGILHSAAA